MRRPGLIFLLCSLYGCGFAPNDSLTGRRIGEGISPWLDLGAVELCLGNDRIGPEGSAVGGFCVGVNMPPERICSTNGDCASREECVCGRCTVKYCSANSECGPLHACSFSDHRCLPSCRAAEDCTGANEICSAGLCKGRCGTDADCQFGEVCGGQSRCVVAACDQDGDCHSSEICKVQRVPRATDEPSVMALPAERSGESPLFVMYLEMADATGQGQIWRSRSRDGISYRFDPATPVLTATAHAPSIVQLAGGYRLYVETAAGIEMAESRDGKNFGALSMAIPGDYHAPAAVATASGVLVYVEVGERRGVALWSGAGTPQPVFGPDQATDPELWRSVEKVGSPFALLETSALGEPTVHLWFDAFGRESGTSIQFGMPVELPANDSIGFASARATRPGELATYPWNPVFDRTVAFLQHRGERAPAVVRVPGQETFFLYYSGSSTDGTEHDGIGVAIDPPRIDAH